MEVLDIYRNLLRELDKFESPTFTVKDFNYFYNLAISRYITENYGNFDVIQKDLDDIRALIVFNRTLTIDATDDIPKASLPAKYRHCLSVKATLKFTENTLDNNKDDSIVVYPKRLITNRKGYVEKNAYQEPSSDYTMYQIDDKDIHILTDSKVSLSSLSMDFIENPTEIDLADDGSSGNDASQFSEYVDYEIIKICRMIFLENIESPRYQTSLNDSQINKIQE